MGKTIDLMELGAELHAELKTQRKISALLAAVAAAEAVLILCFGIGQMFF